MEETTEDLTVNVNRFEDKYTEQNLLGEGGYGSVFAGYRKADHLPVSVAHTFSYAHIHTIGSGRTN